MHFEMPRHGAVNTLDDVPRTLLIPLAARAHASALVPSLDPEDRYAADVLQRSGVQVQDLHQDMATVVNVLWRTRLIKHAAQAFFAEHPTGSGVNLGAGLAQYFQWLDTGHNRWVDADLPAVLALRQRWVRQRSTRCRTAPVDISRPGWLRDLERQLGDAEPWLVVCEGVLMYLQPIHVRAVLRELADHAPEGSQLLCDFISPLGIGHAGMNTSMAPLHAEFLWGAHNGEEIASLHPRLELLAQHSVSEAYGWGASLMEYACSPWTGGPMYAVAHLRVGSA